MARRWDEEPGLVEALSDHLFSLMAVFPKQLVRLDELVHAFEMPASQILILSLLQDEEMSIGELSDRMNIAKPNITPLVDSLAERELVNRSRSSKDRRVVTVTLTQAGKDCAAEIKKKLAEQLQQRAEPLSRSEAKAMNSAMETLTRLIKSLG